MDRISTLPEHILHSILDFLEQPDLGEAALLSKSWTSVVQSHPCLSFKDPKSSQLSYPLFSKTIDRSIHNKTVINRFSLVLRRACDSHQSLWQSSLDSWIQHLVTVGLKDLTLFLGSKHTFIFPHAGLCSNTLTNLNLSSSFNIDVRHCAIVNLPNLLELQLNISDHNRDLLKIFVSCFPNLCRLTLTTSGLNMLNNFAPRYPNLLELTLETSDFTELVCNNVISGCPNLLKLKLTTAYLTEGVCKIVNSCCPNLETLDIYLSHSTGVTSSVCVLCLTKLRSVKLSGRGITRVNIVSPKLQIFNLHGGNGNTPEIGPEIELLGCESTLKVLWLCGLKLTKETLWTHIAKFPGLEELILWMLNVDSIQIPNKKIRKLEIGECYELEKLDIDASNPKLLTIYCNQFRDNFSRCIGNFKECFHNLMNEFNDMKVTLEFGHNMIISEVFDESFVKMLHEMKRVPSKLKVERAGSYELMLDGILTERGVYKRIDCVSIVSRVEQSGKNVLKVLNDMTRKVNVDPESWKYCEHNERKYVLYEVKFINGNEIPNYFKSYDRLEYKITHLKLLWDRLRCGHHLERRVC